MALSFADKVKSVLFEPDTLFQKVKSEKLGESFKYYFLLAIVEVILLGIGLALFSASLFGFWGMAGIPAGALFAGFSIVFLVMMFISSLIGVFITAGIYHIIALLFGGKGDYSSTFKAAAYASTPSALLIWIPVVNFLSIIWWVYLMARGLSAYHRFSFGRGLLVTLVPLIVVLVLAALFGALFPAAGLSGGYPVYPVPA